MLTGLVCDNHRTFGKVLAESFSKGSNQFRGMEQSADHNSPVKTRVASHARGALIAMCGFVDSLYLLFHHVQVNGGYQWGPSVCDFGGVFQCSDVARSVYSEIFGIPVASFGVLYYIVLLLYFFAYAPMLKAGIVEAEQETLQKFSESAMAAAFLGLPGTLMYAYFSLFKLGSICIFCSLLYLVSIVLCVVVYFAPERRIAGVRPPFFRSLSRGAGELLCFAGTSSGLRLVLIGIFAAAALYLSPQVLVSFVFEPWRESQIGHVEMERLYGMWHDSQRVGVPLRLDADPRERDFSEGAVVYGEKGGITVVVFSDFECPFCKRAAILLRELCQKHSSQINLVFKNYPLDAKCNPKIGRSRHEFACDAAVMARCAGMESVEQFWRMHDALFALDELDWTPEHLAGMAAKLGLNVAPFQLCLGNEAVLRRVREDAELGLRLGVIATPTIFVDGKRLSYSNLEQVPYLLDLVLMRTSYEHK